VSKAFWIQVFLLLHVLGAIAALGPTLTYALWRRRAETMAREHLVFTLETVGWVDSRIATPAYISQAVTGTVIIALTGINIFHTAWLLTGVAIYVVISSSWQHGWRPTHRTHRHGTRMKRPRREAERSAWPSSP
jgi:uncharacterized membrane protein